MTEAERQIAQLQIEQLRSALAQIGDMAMAMRATAMGCSQTHGDPGGGLEMLCADAERIYELATRLDEYDKTEWRDVVRKVRPDWTDEKFEAEWARFQEFKQKRKMQ